ncbi:DUF6304 family protein [Streptomyces sp. NPDC001941]|uniref:DUF6304 family protein n=1 Tax=Streptomyces sp. NPDC001941 TaxID=3154659 RepID=UPI00332175D6
MSSESTEVWAGWYRDRRGAESIVITARGRQVSTRIRGVEYGGDSFAALGETGTGTALAGCVLEWDLPLPVSADGAEHRATLSCLLALGEPGRAGAPERADLNATLHFGGAAYESGVVDGDLAEALDRIRRQLPPGVELSRVSAHA